MALDGGVVEGEDESCCDVGGVGVLDACEEADGGGVVVIAACGDGGDGEVVAWLGGVWPDAYERGLRVVEVEGALWRSGGGLTVGEDGEGGLACGV